MFSSGCDFADKTFLKFIQDTDVAGRSLENYQAYLAQSTSSTAKFTTALKDIGANLAVSAVISLVMSAISGLATAGDEIAQKAQELGNSFVSSKDEIADYKTQVEDLYGTINNQSSSIAEVTDARKQLLSIQSEMIEQYGTEQASIEAITDAINGEADAWEKLVAEKWTETKNDFNGDSSIWKNAMNLFQGYDNNMDRMKDEYGNYEATVDLTNIVSHETQDEVKELLREFGEFEINDSGIESVLLDVSGNATEVYNKLLNIQGLLDDYDLGKDFDNHLTKLINDAKEVSNQYKEIYDQFVLNDKILKDTGENGYAESFKEITEEYDKYMDAVNSNDAEEVESAKESFAKAVIEKMDKAVENGDADVADYFKNMYPDLQEEIESWNFEIKFDANTDNLQDDIDDSLIVLKDFSKEELLNFNIASATDEQVEAYRKLQSIAREYMPFEDLINKFEEKGLILSESYQTLVDKFGQEAVDKLDTKDLQIAYTISTEEADEAIEKEKNKIKTELQSLSEEGNVDLTIRPIVKASTMKASGWDVENGSISTTFTQGEFIWQGSEDSGQYVYVHYTPILPDGTALSPDELSNYLTKTLEGSEDILEADEKGIVLKVDDSLTIPEKDIDNFQSGLGSTNEIDNYIKKASSWDNKLHSIQEDFYGISDGANYASIALQKIIKQKKALDYTVSYDPSTAFDAMKTALEEQANQGYLTDSTLQSLKTTYGDLSDVILNTANGVQLNSAAMLEMTEKNGKAALANTYLKEADAVKKREDAVEKLDKRLKEYVSKSKLTTAQENRLKKARKEGTQAMLKEVDASKKLTASQKEVLAATINEIEELNNEINKYDTLEQSILSSISAINLYKKAKETANASDNYNFVQSEIETNKTAFDNGLTKTDDFKEWMKYIGGFNQSLEYSDAEIQKYMNRVERYYTENGSGLFNWLDDASVMSQGMVQKLADGSYSINITDINTLAQRMDQSVSSVTDILLRMSETSGFDIDFSNLSDSLVSGLESLPDNVYDARTQLDEYKSIIDQLKEAGYDTSKLEEQYDAVYANLHPELDIAFNVSNMSESDLLAKALSVVDDVQKKLGETDVKINLDSTDIDDIDKQVKAISEYRDTIDVGVDPTGYENATILMKQLLDNKHQLEIEQAPVLTADTSELEENVQKAVATIQAYVEAKQQLENAKAGTVDVSVADAEAQLASVTSTLQDMTADLYVLGVTADVTVDPDKFMEQIASINVNDHLAENQTDINVGADTTQADKDVEDAKARIESQTANVKVGANTTGMATTISEYLASQSFSVNVTANVVTSGGGSSDDGGSSSGKKGKGKFTGSANAQGTWNIGNQAGRNTLVGEIAPEIWVHDGIWETVGDNGAEFITTHPSDIIFNHKQSEQILKYGKLNSRGRLIGGSFLMGSAFSGLTANGSVVSRNDYSKYHSVSSSSSNSNQSSNNNTNTTTSQANEEAEEFKETLDWIERKLKAVERDIDNLDKTASAAYKSWSERNTALSSEIAKVNEEISIQQQAYQRYIQQAESVGLSDSYKQLIQAGKIDIETITDEDLKEKIDEYQDW